MNEQAKTVGCPNCSRQNALGRGRCLYCGAPLDANRQCHEDASGEEEEDGNHRGHSRTAGFQPVDRTTAACRCAICGRETPWPETFFLTLEAQDFHVGKTVGRWMNIKASCCDGCLQRIVETRRLRWIGSLGLLLTVVAPIVMLSSRPSSIPQVFWYGEVAAAVLVFGSLLVSALRNRSMVKGARILDSLERAWKIAQNAPLRTAGAVVRSRLGAAESSVPLSGFLPPSEP